MSKKARAFTLLEILLGIALLGILASMATPAFLHLYQNDLAEGVANKLVAVMNFARHKAARENKVVVLCKSADARFCGGQWKQGGILFVDKNHNQQRDFDEELLYVLSALPPSLDLKWESNLSLDYLRFPTQFDGKYQNGTFKIFSRKTKEILRSVVISRAGLIKKPNEFQS